MSNKKSNLDSIFEAAIEIESLEERDAFVKAECGDDLELRQQLEQLLAADERAGSFLEKPPEELDATIANGLPAESSSSSQRLLNDSTDQSVLRSIGQTIDVPHVLLREVDGEDETPVERVGSAERPDSETSGRYRVYGEIARGGMGAILKGRDNDLGRDLAIKVLLDEHNDKPEVIQRFIEEAQIGGQLQHPGIAPVYELGQFADQRPFFSMKLVKGQTLSKLLSARKNPAEDRSRFIGIFEHICQTLSYAHVRGVIHRDLKPSNIMVGAFGEVQVMDWGLAKVLPSGGVADEKKAQTKHKDVSVIETRRSAGSDLPGSNGSGSAETKMGSVMGTPAYMPPEQALGEIDQLDQRADVFGLGAILCEILTGKPPYVGKDATAIFRMASRGKLDDAFERLDACGADAELIALAKNCLAAEPDDRPEIAGVVAEQVTHYLESVESKLRVAEQQRAAEEARVVEQKKRMRVTLSLATVVVIVLIGGIAGTAWQARKARQAAADEKAANELAQQALAREAEQREVAEANFTMAKEAVDTYLNSVTSDKQLRQDNFHQLRKKLLETAIPFYKKFAAIEANDPESKANHAYAYFRLANIQDELGDLLAAADNYRRSQMLFEGLLKQSPHDFGYQSVLLAVCQNLGGTLVELGEPEAAKEANQRALELVKMRAVERLGQEMAERPNAKYIGKDLAEMQMNEGVRLWYMGDHDAARAEFEAVLWMAVELQKLHPEEPDISMLVAGAYTKLANLFDELDQHGKARQSFRSGLDIKRDLAARFPDEPKYQTDLGGTLVDFGVFLKNQGEEEAARKEWATAFEILNTLVERFPEVTINRRFLATLLNQRGQLSLEQGQREAAHADLSAALKIGMWLVERNPEVEDFWYTFARTNYLIGRVLDVVVTTETARREYIAALQLYRKAAERRPNTLELLELVASRHNELGLRLSDRGDTEGQHIQYAAALEIQESVVERFPESADRVFLAKLHNNFGNSFRELGEFEKSLAERGRAVEIRRSLLEKEPDNPDLRFGLAFAYNGFAVGHLDVADVEPALPYLSQAIELLQPLEEAESRTEAVREELKRAHFLRMLVLTRLERRDEALESYRTLAKLDSENASLLNAAAWFLVSPAAQADGPHDPAQAVAWAKEACRLAADKANYWNTLGVAHYRNREWQESLAALQKSVDLGNDDPGNWLFIAMCHWQLDDKETAGEFYEKSLEWKEENKEKLVSDTDLQGCFDEGERLLKDAKIESGR